MTAVESLHHWDIFPEAPSDRREVLKIEGVTVRFGGITALDDVSTVLHAGEFLAVIGPNGAGKTTLLNTICGVNRRAATGRIDFGGTSIFGYRPVQIARAGIGRSFQHPPLIEKETVVENILAGAHLELQYTMASQILRPRHVREVEDEIRSRALEMLELVGLRATADQPVASLPYGAWKLIDLIRAMISGPRLLLLDEPTSGLDSEEQVTIKRLLLELRATGRVTILIVEHHMDLVRAVATAVVGLQAGRVLAYGPPAEVLDSEEFRAAMVGKS
jgi:ABC-type branched-subunit amino acid transport system ATPase component